MILPVLLADLNSAALQGQRVGIVMMGLGAILAGAALIIRKPKSAPPAAGSRIAAWVAGVVLILAGTLGPLLFWPE